MKLIFLMSREVLCSLVGRGERLRRQLVGCWELLLVAEVLLVTLLVYTRPVQTSVLLAEYPQGFQADCSIMLLNELNRRQNWSVTLSKYWATRQLL